MYKIYLLVLAMCCLQATATHAQTLAAARVQGPGASVTISGIVTNGPELGPIRYLEDGTAGLSAYFQAAQLTATPIFKGDSIEVTGTLKNFNNLLEVDPVALVRVISRNHPTHPPITVDAANASSAFVEANEGRLIRINGLTSLTSSSGSAITAFAGNANYRLNGSAALVARVNTLSNSIDSGLVGKPAPQGAYDVIGVLSQFCAAPVNTCNTGYQLLPRVYADFISGPSPNINTVITVDSIGRDYLVLGFSTQNPGDTRLFYGTSPNLTNQVATAPLVTAHQMRINGLQPGMLYYIRAQSRNSSGTSNSSIQTFVTESNSSGRIKTYFTRSTEPTTSLPGNVSTTLSQLVDDTLVQYIGRARQTLDISIYNYNNNGINANIAAAINAAKQRGVRVRLIADGGSANIGLSNLTNIPILRSPTGTNPTGGFYGLMHNKFVVIDAEAIDANQPIVWTGSTNWTDAQINRDYNNLIIIQDQSLARVYQHEFEEMWGSKSDTAGAIFNGTIGTARFGANKTDNTPHEAKIAGKRVEIYFSPSDQVNRNIIRTINSAQTSFQFSQLLITRTDLGLTIRARYDSVTNRACTGGMVEDTSSSGGVPFIIMNNGTNNAFKIYRSSLIFHHKYLIVDQDAPNSDPLVWTGSHNWSNAGDQRNDENSIVIHDQAIANQYYQEFAARYAELNGTICPLTAIKHEARGKISLYPNPATSTLSVNGLKEGLANYTITDAAGRAAQKGKLSGSSFSVGNLKSGVYHLTLSQKTGNTHHIFVKQ